MKVAHLPPAMQKVARAQLATKRGRKSEAEKAADRAKATAARLAFFGALRYAGLPLPLFEYRFHGVRKWRFDYCWPEHRIALEVDGGLYVNGGHNRGAYMEEMHNKFNEAAALGWRALRTTPRKLCKPTTIAIIKLALEWNP